jgi:transcriptional regulator with XRE-family HTH domain
MESFDLTSAANEAIDLTSMQDIASAIRAIRKQKGLTLKDVEVQSNGLWKSVVIGSYERCDRTLSLKKAIALAGFYQVPLDQLLGLSKSKLGKSESIILDLRAIRENSEKSRLYAGLSQYIKAICEKRRDWNGELLSIRAGDLFHVALLQGVDEPFVLPWLRERNYLFK